MQPSTYYPQRIQSLQVQLSVFQKKKSKLAWLRFGAIAFIIALLFILWPYGTGYALGGALVFLIVFVRLVFSDLKNRSALTHTTHLLELNRQELEAAAHRFQHFEDGKTLMPALHDYANDLDIFGPASLYQYVNRSRSDMGNTTLANWLLHPAGTAAILERQEAVKELSQTTEWRQELQAYGTEKKISHATKERLENWLTEPDDFSGNLFWKIVRYLVPAIVLIIIGLEIAGIVDSIVRNYALLGSGLLAFYISRKAMVIHAQVSKIADELEVMSGSIRLVENTVFKSDLLNKLQQVYKKQETKASAELNSLKKILERFDLRYNPVVFVPLDLILQWDLQQVMALGKWKKNNRQNIGEWFDALGELEALNSFGTLAFNHPEWCYPVLHEQHFFIEANGMGHPLIPPAKRVDNDIRITESGELMLVTGSNMAGKSTYLRSVGVNIVLAMAGAPVCAQRFEVSPVQLISSMRIADNLEESTSTFYAELKKLKAVIDKVNNGEKVFILLDEILRGTNSLDRHTGSAALIKQLINHHAAAIIATHDVELAKLKEVYPANILNYHFDVQVDKDELYFDYRLKPGICTSLNASILMRKIGIEL
jgi:hypothetical protein